MVTVRINLHIYMILCIICFRISSFLLFLQNVGTCIRIASSEANADVYYDVSGEPLRPAANYLTYKENLKN